LKPINFCLANLIIEEAGGVMMDPLGKPLDLENRRVLAGNQHITKLIVDVLNKQAIPEKWLKYDKH
jgi:fructose-1,6-bisphosphatase/inositol monophosphatase family enzyme